MRSGEGAKDRVTVMPAVAAAPFTAHLARVRALHLRDLARGGRRVGLPGALGRKYPNAAGEWGCRWVFPATSRYRDPATRDRVRHYLHGSAVQRAVRDAAGRAGRAGLAKRVTCHTFGHSFATAAPTRHLLEAGYAIRTVQELLGHTDVRTTMVYTHVLNRGGRGVVSPADLPGPEGRAPAAR